MVGEVVATDRIGNVLAQQATKMGGSPVTMLDEGVVPAFGARAGEFQAAMQGNVFFSNNWTQTPKVTHKGIQGIQGIPPLGPQTPGSSVLDSLQGVRDQFMKIQNNIEKLIQKKQDFSSADLMQMQYDVMQLSYINELSSKVSDKTSQGARTLFTNQG